MKTVYVSSRAPATQLVSNGDGATLIYNGDAAATLWIGDSPAVSSFVPLESIPLAPSSSISVDGNNDVYAIADPSVKQIETYVIAGGTSFFQPASLANLGGAKVFVQPTDPTTTIPAASIPANSIWFDTSNGSLQTWDGAGWDNQAFSAQNLIQAATILGAQIANQAVSTAKIANLAINRGLIANGAISDQQVGSDANLNGAKLANQSVTATQVANGTLTTAQLAAAAGILGTQIANATINGANIAAHTIVAGNIAANAIGVNELAANIIYAGIVDGTTIQGANFVATGTSGEFLGYNGVPAHGNLIASVSARAAIDSFSNAFRDGIASYGPSGGVAYLAVNQSSGIPFLILVPHSAANNNSPPQAFGTVTNAGLANEYSALTLDSGYETGSLNNNAEIFLQSKPNDNSNTSFIVFLLDGSQIGYFEPTGFHLNVSLFGSGGIVVIGDVARATHPGTPNPETWQTLSLINGWGVTSAGVSYYRKTVENELEVVAFLDASTATNANFAAILPSGYFPATLCAAPVAANKGVSAGVAPWVQFSTSGQLSIQGVTLGSSGQTIIVFARLPLDL